MVQANQTQGMELESAFVSQQPSIFFRQPSKWSRAIAWGIISFTAFGITWASLAEVEKVIPSQGKLEPKASVQEVQTPIDGVVESVFVKDGDPVQAGDVLLSFDTTTTESQLASLKKVQQSLKQENKFYRTLLNGKPNQFLIEKALIELNLPTEVASMANTRLEILAENELYQIQAGNSQNTSHLTPQQLARLQASQAELKSRVASSQLEASKLEKQLNQIQVQLANARERLATEKEILQEVSQQNQKVMAQIKKNLSSEEAILNKLEPLAKEGAVSQLQVERQRQQVNNQQRDLVQQETTGKMRFDQQRQAVQSTEAEIKQLQQEYQRLQVELMQAKENVNNTQAISAKEVQEKLAANFQRLAEIDSQIGKLIVENEKQITEAESQIQQVKQSLKYHEIKAPKSGIVFELKAHPGFVANPSQTVLEIVPDDALVAEIYISNKDRGFVKEGMEVDVRVDAFDFSEYGDIKGKIIWIGKDALEPNAIYPYYRFPAKVQLDQQYMMIKGTEMPLESGMSVSVNIKERKRKVISIFFGSLMKKVDALKEAK